MGTHAAYDFTPATAEEKEHLVVLRESVSFARDAWGRLLKNHLAVISAVLIFIILVFAFFVPVVYPYSYETQIRGSESLAPMAYSAAELAKIDAGESVFPHYFGTDALGRDYAVRVMVGAKISLLVGIGASLIVLVVGSVYGTIAAYFGGKVDMVMMRILDILASIPDILIIILLMVSLKFPLRALADAVPQFEWINTVGVPLVCIFIVFGLLYWMNMARIVRGQVLTLKESEFITAAKALGGSNSRIIRKHIMTNCIGTLIVTTTLQIPSAIFTESFLSFLGIGVAAPLPSLGSLATDAITGMQSYPHILLIPALLISLIILTLNLFGDGLRDAFDPKLRK
ncbi:peptide ABC transporter permease [Clostridia bacterium]|nr:peptide ABC transporter permease [Clostridia bacterium]